MAKCITDFKEEAVVSKKNHYNQDILGALADEKIVPGEFKVFF